MNWRDFFMTPILPKVNNNISLLETFPADASSSSANKSQQVPEALALDTSNASPEVRRAVHSWQRTMVKAVPEFFGPKAQKAYRAMRQAEDREDSAIAEMANKMGLKGPEGLKIARVFRNVSTNSVLDILAIPLSILPAGCT